MGLLRGKCVLLCEDNELNAEIIQLILEQWGMKVVWARDGQQGIEKLEIPDTVCDIVLMDRRMPVMDGLEASRRIRLLAHPDARQIPIIAMTANAFDNDVTASLKAGMNAHLAKPIDPENLYETLRRLIRNKQ